MVTFETFKERETVLRNAKALSKKARIHVTEDLSKRTREARAELRKFMRQVKRQNPERSCFLEYDKLYVDHRPFVWNEVLLAQFFCPQLSHQTNSVLLSKGPWSSGRS